MDSFADLMGSERQRITSARNALVEQRGQIDEAIRDLDREMEAIAAYEKAKNGKAPRGTNGARKQRHGGKREQVVGIVAANPHGARRRDLLEALGVKGDKSGEMSVSNALTALTKNGTLVRHDGGRYVLSIS